MTGNKLSLNLPTTQAARQDATPIIANNLNIADKITRTNYYNAAHRCKKATANEPFHPCGTLAPARSIVHTCPCVPRMCVYEHVCTFAHIPSCFVLSHLATRNTSHSTPTES